MTTPNVTWTHPDLAKILPVYTQISDCIEGQPAIKAKTTTYLPEPHSSARVIPGDANGETRYKSYLTRALFYNVTGRTLAGLIGQVFMRNPVIKAPKELASVIEDADGCNVSLCQLARRAVAQVSSKGRAGVLTDFPKAQGEISKADLEAGAMRPTITHYNPENIINWRVTRVGAEKKLTLVVLKEPYLANEDGFQQEWQDQYKVLRIAPSGYYQVEVYRVETNPENKASELRPGDRVYMPRDAAGEPFTEIPFDFIGSGNNDICVDKPPLSDLSDLNIAHYRNSADYEESCFMVGQPTPYFTGLTEDWVKNVLKGGIALGSRGAVPLPADSSAGLLQVQPNSMPLEAMKHKEHQMVALGARLVEEKQVQRTATEVDSDDSGEKSVLAMIARNVSAAYTNALKWAAVFVGTSEETISVELNLDFDTKGMSANERQQLLLEWQSGAIAFDEMRVNLTESNVARLDAKEAKVLIDAENKERDTRLTKQETQDGTRRKSNTEE